MHFGVERRRLPRVQSDQDVVVVLGISIPVQVLDISLAGVQLASKTELAVGDHGELRAAVGSQSIALMIEIRRVSVENNQRAGTRYRAGAVFFSMSEEQRAVLVQLLGTERS